MPEDVPIRLQALNDAFQTVSDLYDRLEEEWELDQEDELLTLIAGVRGAVAQLAADAGASIGMTDMSARRLSRRVRVGVRPRNRRVQRCLSFGWSVLDGVDLGPFVSSVPNWAPGDEIPLGPGRGWRVIAMVSSADDELERLIVEPTGQ